MNRQRRAVLMTVAVATGALTGFAILSLGVPWAWVNGFGCGLVTAAIAIPLLRAALDGR